MIILLSGGASGSKCPPICLDLTTAHPGSAAWTWFWTQPARLVEDLMTGVGRWCIVGFFHTRCHSVLKGSDWSVITNRFSQLYVYSFGIHTSSGLNFRAWWEILQSRLMTKQHGIHNTVASNQPTNKKPVDMFSQILKINISSSSFCDASRGLLTGVTGSAQTGKQP